MTTIRWERFPLSAREPQVQMWLTMEADLGRAQNTVEAYARGLEAFLGFLGRSDVPLVTVSRANIAAYVRDLGTRSSRHEAEGDTADFGQLANATLQQRITAIRLFYDYLIEEGLRSDNPVGRGRYTPTGSFGGTRVRGLIPRYVKLPWVPTDEEWQAILEAAGSEPIRNRLMWPWPMTPPFGVKSCAA